MTSLHVRRFVAVALCVLPLAAGIRAQPHALQTPAPASALGPTGSEPERDVDVAVNRSGDGIIVGRSLISSSGGSQYLIWAQALRRGQPAGSLLTVANASDPVTGTQELTRVRCAIDEYGNWVAVWDALDVASGWLQPFARRYHAGSGQFGPVIRVPQANPLRHAVLPDVAIGPYPLVPGSSFYVVWQDGVTAGQSTIRLRRFRILESGGSATDVADPEEQVNSEPTQATIGGQDRPAVAVDATGILTVVWEKYGAWGAGVAYWRIMARRRVASSWLGIYDPASPSAGPNGVDMTDYEVSALGDPAQNSDARYPPRVAAAADGSVIVAWKRYSGAPYGLTALVPGPNSAATALADYAYVPPAPAAGFGRFDVDLTNEGSTAFLWESWQTTVGISGRILLSRIRFPSHAQMAEAEIDAAIGPEVFALAVSSSDGGKAETAWTRGPSGATMAAARRGADLNLVEFQSSAAGNRLHMALGRGSGFFYQLWPSASGGTPAEYAALPLGDGRAADLLLADPLLQWWFASGGAPFLASSVGAFDGSSEASVSVFLPPGILPIPVRWTLIVVDPVLSFPATVRMFAQPETIGVF